MYKDKYELNILVNGKPVREYFHNNKFFIEAKNGTEYSLKLKNHSHKKIMAVISVDGIEVLKGGKASESNSGYIVNPYSSINIQGYRIDDNNVATFKFSDGKNSYATQVEQKFNKENIEKVEKGELAPARNNGVIGIRIWEEKEPKIIPEWNNTSTDKKWFYNKVNSWSGNTITGCLTPFHMISGAAINLFQLSGCSASAFGTGNSIMAAANYVAQRNNTSINNVAFNPINTINYTSSTSNVLYSTTDSCFDNIPYNPNSLVSESKQSLQNYTPSFDLGTTWGKQQEDKVIKVKFERAESYINLECFYLIRDELIKMGVDLENSKKVFISGFPKAFGDDEYCKEPINWRNK